MTLLSTNLLYCLRLFVPSYFGLFTIEFGNLQNPSIIFWTRDKYTNKSYSLTIYKREENKNKRTLVSIESLIILLAQGDFNLVLVLSLTLVPNWISMGQMAMRCFLTLNQSVNLFKIIGKVLTCIFHSKLFKTIDAECTIKSNLTLLPGAPSDDPSQWTKNRF